MVDPRNTVSGVKEWLKGQGFPLEMETSRAFRTAGFRVQQSAYYQDETGEWAERDVIASLQDSIEVKSTHCLFRTSAVIECKLSRENAWVVFTTQSNLHHRAWISQRCASKRGRMLLQNLADRSEIRDLPLFIQPETHGYAITQAHRKPDNKMDHAYFSALSVAKSASALAKAADALAGQRMEYGLIAAPAVVTEAPLFEARLDDAGELQVNAVGHSLLALKAPFAGGPHSFVHVVNRESLPQFVKDVRDTFEGLISAWLDDFALWNPQPRAES